MDFDPTDVWGKIVPLDVLACATSCNRDRYSWAGVGKALCRACFA